MAKKRKRPRSALEKAKIKAWEILSPVIRLESADHRGYVQCVTCGIVNYYKDQIHAGHFLAHAGRNRLKWDERNIAPQCAMCNHNEGSGPQFYQWMEKNRGIEVINELIQLRYQTQHLRLGEVEAMIERYSARLKAAEERLAQGVPL
jgi:hypothetical protein